MASTVQRPAATLQIPQSEDYDPCALAKPCSPFYLYNHESPRPSMEMKPKASVQVTERDMELGDADLSPTVSQEKLENQKKTPNSRFKFWQKSACLQAGPKRQGRIARLPKQQRVLAKLAITLLILGCMVGIAVGIAVGLKSTVWKNNNQVGNIGT